MPFPITSSVKLGFLPAHRGFFSAELARGVRAKTIEVLQATGGTVVVPTEEETNLGCVENLTEARLAGRKFREQGVDGVVVGGMDFGDEQGIALALREAGLDVPVLLFGCQEEGALRIGSSRRDAFCGLLSIADALRQTGQRYSIPRRPILSPHSGEFAEEIHSFFSLCRVVRNLRRARYGQIGARPDAFWTCRYDERSLQRLGPTSVVLDLSEILLAVSSVGDENTEVAEILAALPEAGKLDAVPPATRLKLAKFEWALRRVIREKELDAVAIQCWTSLQMNLGICSCFAMSRLSDMGIPAACEADIPGAMSMHALQSATNSATALADWNNLHHEDDDLVNLWHCGVFPASLVQGTPVISNHEILSEIAKAVPPEDAMGVVDAKLRPGPVTLCRIAPTESGHWRALLVEGEIEDRPETSTRGSFGWCRIPGLLDLYRDVLLRRYPHHVALTAGKTGKLLEEALGTYLGLEVETHAL